MAESVVCTFCGAKIKEGRTKCLRCGETLVAADATKAPAGWRASVGRHRGRLTIAASAVSVLILLAVAFNLQQPAAIISGSAATPVAKSQPVSPAVSPAVAAADTSPVTAQSVPVTDLDAQRQGNAAYAKGDFAGALESYELAVKKNPDSPTALNNLGQALVRVGRAKEALPHFERATTLSPSEWTPRFNLAHAYGVLEDWPHAITQYEQAARLFPDDYVTHYNLGMAFHKAAREEPAVAEFQRAIALAPSEASFHLSLAISYERLKRHAEAATAYEEYLALAPNAAEASRLRTHIGELRNPPPPQG